MQSLVAFVLLATIGAEAQPWARHTIDNSSRGADGVRLADVSGDGLMDITTPWEEGGVIRVYINPGPGKAKEHWPAATVGEVRSGEDAVFADLDGDGAVDVVSSCEGGTRSVFVHWAPHDADRYLDAGKWKTEAIPAAEKQQLWMFALPMEIDGQGGIDLVLGSKGGNATVGWLQSPTDPRDVSAWKYHPLRKAGWIMSLQAHDMDGDGDPDVLLSDRNGALRGVYWLENPGAAASSAGHSWKEHKIGATDRECMFLTAADVNGDGRRDVVVAAKGSGLIYFEATGKKDVPWRSREIPLPPNSGSGKGVAAGDVDKDGRCDLVFTCEHAQGKSGVWWMSCDGPPSEGAWRNHDISGAAGAKFDRVELIDLDGDGDLDVLTCEERDNLGVIWYENPH